MVYEKLPVPVVIKVRYMLYKDARVTFCSFLTKKSLPKKLSEIRAKSIQ